MRRTNFFRTLYCPPTCLPQIFAWSIKRLNTTVLKVSSVETNFFLWNVHDNHFEFQYSFWNDYTVLQISVSLNNRGVLNWAQKVKSDYYQWKRVVFLYKNWLYNSDPGLSKNWCLPSYLRSMEANLFSKWP